MALRAGAAAVTVNLNSGAAIQWGTTTGFNPSSLILNQATAIGTLNFQNPLDLNGATRTATVNTTAVANSGQISGAVSNSSATAANLTKTGPGRLVLSGANTYNGGSTVSAGILQFANPGAMPATGTVTVAAGTTLAVNAGGTGEFTTATTGAGSIGGLAAGTGGQGAPVNFSSGSNVGIDPSNATGASLTYGGVITDFGANSLGVTKLGAASTLVLSGANTYTGVTDISAGTLNVPNFSDYGVAGSLGARLASQETATGDGIGIHIGSASSGATLQYTGSAPQSTNRQIRLAQSTTDTIDASGTTASATLSFTNSGAQTNLFDTAGTRTLNLIGSNTGNNLFAIPLTDQSTNATSLTKNGTGTWVLTGNSTFTGGVNINQGILTIRNAAALGGGTKTINLSNGTAGNPQLHLDGSAGAISLPATFTYSTSNNSSATTGVFVNDAGNNTIAGTINPIAGGGDTPVVVNAGTLTIAATVTQPANNGLRNLRLPRPRQRIGHRCDLQRRHRRRPRRRPGGHRRLDPRRRQHLHRTDRRQHRHPHAEQRRRPGATAVTVGSGAAITATAGNATLLVRGNNTVGTAAGGSITVNGGDAPPPGRAPCPSPTAPSTPSP